MTHERLLSRLRAYIRLAILVCGLILPAAQAFALTGQEAASVVELIETLQPELGQFAYDDGIAAQWWESDAADKGLIARAGFSAESWGTALGETVKGFLATLGEDELETIFGKLKSAINAIEEVGAEQKAEMIAAIDAEVVRFMALRAEGEPYAEIVRPYAPKIRALILDPTLEPSE